MATELGKAYVQIMPSSKGISGSIQKALDPESKTAGKSSGRSIMSGIKGAIIKAGIGVAIAKTLTDTVKAGGALEQSIGGIETLFKDNANTVIKYANEAYKTVGVSANEYMENVTSFSASLLQSMGGDTKKAAEVANMAMVDMGDNANKMGTDMRDIQNAYQGFAKQNYTMLDNLKLGYGGTKGEMERLLKDATKLSGVKYNINNLSDVYEAIHVIQKEIGITGTTALEAEETIQGSFSAMKSAFTNTLGSLAIGENVTGSFKALAETIATFLFDNLIPMIGQVIMNLPEAIAAFIQAAVPKISEILLSALNSAGGLGDVFADGMYDGVYSAIVWTLEEGLNVITEKIPDFLNKGVELITNLADGVLREIPFFIRGVGGLLEVAIEFIAENAPKFLESGIDLITKLAKGVWDSLPKIIDSISFVLGRLLDTIVKYLPNLIRGGIEIVGKLAKGIWNNLPEIITTLGNLLMKLIGAIRERLPEFMAKGLELIGQLAVGLIKAIPGIVTKIPQIMTAIIKTLASLIGGIVGIGADIVKGLWKGINSVKDWILGKIKGFVGSITNGIKGFFGIKSPSKVMADEVGKWLPMGLAEGIEDNTKPVSKAMEELANLTTGTLESKLAISTAYNGQPHTTSTSRTEQGGIILQFYPQSMTEADLNMAFNYVNRRFGMGV